MIHWAGIAVILTWLHPYEIEFQSSLNQPCVGLDWIKLTLELLPTVKWQRTSAAVTRKMFQFRVFSYRFRPSIRCQYWFSHFTMQLCTFHFSFISDIDGNSRFRNDRNQCRWIPTELLPSEMSPFAITDNSFHVSTTSKKRRRRRRRRGPSYSAASGGGGSKSS